jgi:uncharacterized protein
MKIDMFSHILPEPYLKKIERITPDATGMDARARKAGSISNLDARFRAMDEFGDYLQVINIVAPPVESYGAPTVTRDLAEMANDSLAELVARYPDRFLAFVASVPMNDPDGMVAEAERAVSNLGAAGVQIFTNVNGRPLDKPEYLPIFDLMARLDRPLWLHPTRDANFPDYATEPKSRYEIWWALGWSYETSAAMAHLVFSGLFDKHPGIKIITHHLGGIIPYLEGKVGAGWDYLGTRTTDEDYGKVLRELRKRPIDYFRMFYADTAVFGARAATVCGIEFFGIDHTVFGTDAPFGPEGKWGYTRWQIEVIEGLDITPEQRQAIYEGNARRLLKLD